METEIAAPASLTAAQQDIYKMFSVKLSEDEWRQIGNIISGYIVTKRVDPEILAQSPTRLNEQQLQMLNLLKRPMPDEDYKEIKRAVVKTLAKQADEELERLEKENGWTEETYEQWSKEHFRTPYKKAGW